MDFGLFPFFAQDRWRGFQTCAARGEKTFCFNVRPALSSYVLNSKGGDTSLRELAATTHGHLHWFRHGGQLGVEFRHKGRASIVRDRAAGNEAEQSSFEKLLKTVLAETAAYRKHWRG